MPNHHNNSRADKLRLIRLYLGWEVNRGEPTVSLRRRTARPREAKLRVKGITSMDNRIGTMLFPSEEVECRLLREREWV
jgi:hypothetical protein